jgi:hypothetical protein
MTTGTSPGHGVDRRRCASCASPVGPWAAFCPRCGGPQADIDAAPGGRSAHTVCADPPQAIFTVTLLRCLEGSRPFSLSNASSQGSFSIAPCGARRVGSHADDDIQLYDVTVSKHHAQFVARTSSCSVRDLRSVNGTFVNGARVDEVLLASGDEIQIGRFRLLFLSLRVAGAGPGSPRPGAEGPTVDAA